MVTSSYLDRFRDENTRKWKPHIPALRNMGLNHHCSIEFQEKTIEISGQLQAYLLPLKEHNEKMLNFMIAEINLVN